MALDATWSVLWVIVGAHGVAAWLLPLSPFGGSSRGSGSDQHEVAEQPEPPQTSSFRPSYLITTYEPRLSEGKQRSRRTTDGR